MSEPICFVVMRNGHIMPPGIHMHRVNAEATAAREEGEVVPLYRSPVESVPVAVLEKLAEELREDGKDRKEITDPYCRGASEGLRLSADRLSAIVKEQGK